jgi:hypothetical protein
MSIRAVPVQGDAPHLKQLPAEGAWLLSNETCPFDEKPIMPRQIQSDRHHCK